MQLDLIEAQPGDQITIALAEEPGGVLRPLSIDLQVSSLHVVFSARKASSIDRVFSAEFARTIRGICLALAPETQVVNAPDFRMRMRGLAVEGYTLFAQALEDGLRRFTLRLRSATGNAFALFKLSGPEDEGLSLFHGEVLRGVDQRVGADRLFDEMLAHLYLPLVNLNTYLRSVLDGQRSCSSEQFSASAVQLKARAENLQFAFDRLISELMVERVSAPDVRPPEDYALHEAAAPAPRAPRAMPMGMSSA
jgi:hypothetical protein